SRDPYSQPARRLPCRSKEFSAFHRSGVLSERIHHHAPSPGQNHPHYESAVRLFPISAQYCEWWYPRACWRAVTHFQYGLLNRHPIAPHPRLVSRQGPGYSVSLHPYNAPRRSWLTDWDRTQARQWSLESRSYRVENQSADRDVYVHPRENVRSSAHRCSSRRYCAET